MYELLNVPIPDLDAYLTRLGLTREDVYAPTREVLDKLIYAHQTHIPFENLDSCLLGAVPSLEIPALFDKIILRRRGGYCYEMNGLFLRLLTDLGFRAISVFCRIVNGRDYIPPCTHRGILVSLEGNLLYCDVGYGGPQPPASVLVTEGGETTAQGEAFQVRRFDQNWWILSRTDSLGTRKDVLHFTEFPQTPQEFLPANYYGSASPDSVFTQKCMVNLRTPSGNINITGNILSKFEKGIRTEQALAGPEDLQQALAKDFGICLPAHDLAGFTA